MILGLAVQNDNVNQTEYAFFLKTKVPVVVSIVSRDSKINGFSWEIVRVKRDIRNKATSSSSSFVKELI